MTRKLILALAAIVAAPALALPPIVTPSVATIGPDALAAKADLSAVQAISPGNAALATATDPSANLYVNVYDAGLGGQAQRLPISTFVPDLNGTDLNVNLDDTVPAVYTMRAADRAPRYHYFYAATDRVIDVSQIDYGALYIIVAKYAGAGTAHLSFGTAGLAVTAGGVTSAGQMLDLAAGGEIAIRRLTASIWSVSYYTNPADGGLKTLSLTAATNTLPTTSLNSVALVDTTANAVAATLPSPTGLPGGTFVRFVQIAGANASSIYRTGTGAVQAQTFGIGDEVTEAIVAGAWAVVARKLSAARAEYRVAGSYTVTVPAGAKGYKVWLMGAAAGGGSGRRGAAATARFGGNGGSPGSYIEAEGNAADVGASVTVAVGAGGAGGAAVTVNDTSGNSGTAGGATTFGLSSSAYYASAFGGTAGGGGAAVTTSNASPSQGARATGTGGVSIAGAAVQGTRAWAPGAPSGGGISAADAAGAALGGYGKGWAASALSVDQAAAIGSVLSTTPKAGASGAASITAAAERGYNGADGGPGGGGGASLNGFASGAGGTGSDGWAVIEWRF